MSIESLCDKLVTIKTKVDTRGASGGKSLSWTGSTTVRARVQPASAKEQEVMLQKGFEISHVVYFPSDPGLGNDDLIEVDGMKLLVQGKAVNFDLQGRLYKVAAREVQQEQ